MLAHLVYFGFVDLTSVVATLLGGTIGVGSTLMVDRFRWRRERDRDQGDMRRAVYIRLLAAMNLTQQELFVIAWGVHTAQDSPRRAALDAFRSHGLFSAHEELMITAPEKIRDAGSDAFVALRSVRNAVARGHTRHEKEYIESYRAYQIARDSLRTLMREDLGTRGAQK